MDPERGDPERGRERGYRFTKTHIPGDTVYAFAVFRKSLFLGLSGDRQIRTYDDETEKCNGIGTRLESSIPTGAEDSSRIHFAPFRSAPWS